VDLIRLGIGDPDTPIFPDAALLSGSPQPRTTAWRRAVS